MFSPQFLARYWNKVRKAGPDECWEWLGCRVGGYGMIRCSEWVGSRATHLALTLDGRPRPDYALALHSCDNRGCCNPAHLRWGTAAENTADMINRGRNIAVTRPEYAPCGEAHQAAILTNETVRFIRSSDMTIRALSKMLGVGPSTVQSVRKRLTWKHVP